MRRILIDRKFTTAALLASALLVAGCEAMDKTVETVTLLWKNPIVLPCPDYRILADPARVAQFRAGSGRDLVDIDAEGAVGDIRMACVTDIDKKTGVGSMEIEVAVAFGAKRGPANKSKRALLPYFISVTDKKRNVLYREEFKVAVRFPGNQTSIQFLGESVKLEVPLTAKITSTDYLIYTGFILTRDQLEHNRRLKGRKQL